MSFVTVAIVGGSLAVASGATKGILRGRRAKKDKRRAEKDRRVSESNLNSLINSRQKIINPFEGVTDLSGGLSNPYANLGVATQAAEQQMEQTDIALANTLDTIRATGVAAGGATALAQAALQSKKDVSASIEQQEAQNQKLQAQGEQNLQMQRMAEQQRVQMAEAKGKAYEFETREERQLMELDRAQSQLDESRGRKFAATRAGRAAGDSMLNLGQDLGVQAATFGLGRI